MAPLQRLDIARALFVNLRSEAINTQLVRHARRAIVTAGPAVAKASVHHIARRGLSVNSTQATTLGVIGAYAVAIALLWNLPYVRWSLWPFKVSRA